MLVVGVTSALSGDEEAGWSDLVEAICKVLVRQLTFTAHQALS